MISVSENTPENVPRHLRQNDPGNIRDITAWSESFAVKSKSWLILGKGPTFSKLSQINTDDFHICTLNHVIREVPATIAHVIDIDVVSDCADAIRTNARYLVLPYRPHVNCDPTEKTIYDFIDEIPVLKELANEGRLLWYNLSSSKPNGHSPVIEAKFFSAEAALNILVNCGVKVIRSLGVDGGSQYNSIFADLNDKTLLANGHASFDRQFEGIAKTIRTSGIFYAPLHTPAPVKVFVGTDAAQMIGVKILEYSIKKHASISVTVEAIDDSKSPVPKNPANRSKTGFSFSRFVIPELCKYKGRAIYMDADMLVFDDIIKLWNTPFKDASVLYSELKNDDGGKRVPQFSVMLLNCKELNWDIKEIIKGFDDEKYDYKELMQQICILPDEKKRPGLPYEWNSLEHYEEGRTKLIHYTDMPTQPWVSNKNVHGEIWYAYFREAVEEGFIPIEYVYSEIEKGHASPLLLKWAGLPDPKGYEKRFNDWIAPYKRFSKNKAKVVPEVNKESRLSVFSKKLKSFLGNK